MELKFPRTAGTPKQSASWVRILPSGELEFEFFDYSDEASSSLGGDVAFLYRIPAQQIPLLMQVLNIPSMDLLLSSLVQIFPSALHAGQWLKQNPTFHLTQTFDSQA